MAEHSEKERTEAERANLDPISKAPGSHPVGVAVGASAGGIVAGAAAGTLTAGPIGAVVGGVVGAIAGALGGKAVAEKLDPTVEEAYWRENHAGQSYAKEGTEYDDYAPAYRVGYEGRNRYGDEDFDAVEPQLMHDYPVARGDSQLDWDEARPAARAAWNRGGGAA